MNKEFKNTNNTTKSIVFNALKAIVDDNKAVTGLDASSWAIGLAVKHGLNPHTVDRYRRLYVESRLAIDLESRENRAFDKVLKLFKNKGK